MRVEKRPGWDWIVRYIMDDMPEEMVVFGAMTIEDAVADAHCSLAPVGFEDNDYQILAVERL